MHDDIEVLRVGCPPVRRGNRTYRVEKVYFGDATLTDDDIAAIEAAEEAEQELLQAEQDGEA